MRIKMDDFTGTKAITRLTLRRDRIILPIFIIFMALVVIAIAIGFIKLYSDAAVRMAFFLQMQNNQSIVALLGSVLDPSIGGLITWRTGVAGPLLLGLISIFLMIRHTRSEERKGRLELLDSTAVGRQAALTSALATTFLANIIIAVIIDLGLIGLGLPVYSSIVLGLSMAAFGCLFAAITGVAVQLTESSSDARYLTVAILVGFFLLRILGWDNGKVSWLSWLSPFGWVHYVRPFAGDDLWVFGLFLIFIAGLTVTAFWLSSVRDLGAGIITQRSGPARASKSLRSSLSLAWRLHRGMLLFWIILFAIMGVMFGYTAQTVTDLINTNPQFISLLSKLAGNVAPADSYFTLIIALLGEVFAVYAILATLRLRTEESKKYSEFVLTNSVSRGQWALSNLVFAMLGPAVVMIIFALICGLSYGLTTGNLYYDFLRVVVATLAYLPAVWVLTGISMALFGLLPRLAALSWVALGLFVLIDLLGEFFQVSPWILDISPYTQIPKLLVGETSTWPLFGLVIITALLIVVGIIGYQRRDIA
jgi:ABC-2 type transport system permease protein